MRKFGNKSDEEEELNEDTEDESLDFIKEEEVEF